MPMIDGWKRTVSTHSLAEDVVVVDEGVLSEGRFEDVIGG
jgi:hypothetical protein